MTVQTHVSNLALRTLGPERDADWDALVGQSAASGFMQSSAWAAFKRTEGYETLRVGLFQDEQLCGGASLLVYSHGGQSGFFVCPEGPVLPWHDTSLSRAGLRLLLADCHAQASQYHVIGLRIEPHLPPPRPSLLRNWMRAPVDLTPSHTVMLDLDLSEEAILAQMQPKGRYNSGLAIRHGVEVTHSTDLQDMSVFYALFDETAKRNGFYAEPYRFFLNLGATLFPSQTAALFLARWQQTTLAAILVLFCGRRATYLYGGSSSQQRHVMPNYALHHAAMREARQRGCVEYDFYGYDPFLRPDHEYAGISRFKLQWGGRRVDSMGAHDHIFYDQLADRLVERLQE